MIVLIEGTYNIIGVLDRIDTRWYTWQATLYYLTTILCTIAHRLLLHVSGRICAHNFFCF